MNRKSIFSFYLGILSALLFLVGCKSTNKTFSFYVFSDTHLDGTPTRFDVNDSMITEANNLYEKDFPDSLRYLKKQKPKGVLVCGDLTDGAETPQWSQFIQLYGLHGENNLHFPVYENYGNHDGDSSGVVRQGIKERNTHRKKLTNVSANGLHYSFDWGNCHFVSLGSYPANGWDSTCGWCHYFKKRFREPQNSLTFLKEDLEKYAKSNRKVILYFHYGWDDFSKLWWTENEQDKFYNVIKNYNIAAIFAGHNHATGYLQWKGINVYSAGSPQHNQITGTFLFVQVAKDTLYVIERTLNEWGKYSWKKALENKKPKRDIALPGNVSAEVK